jgi:hypothetical protein
MPTYKHEAGRHLISPGVTGVDARAPAARPAGYSPLGAGPAQIVTPEWPFSGYNADNKAVGFVMSLGSWPVVAWMRRRELLAQPPYWEAR